MTNEVADIILAKLLLSHARVYRNKAKADATFPYVVFRLTGDNDTYPSTDCILDIKVFEKNDGTVSVRTMEALADTINTALNHITLSSAAYEVTLEKTLRQFEDDSSLAGVQFVNLQYSARVYAR